MPTTYTDNSYGQMCSHLHRLRLGDYISVLQENGYESWNQLSTVNEKDFDRLGFKLGHRRRLQREIASMKGHPQSEALQPQSSARKIAPQNSYFGTHDLLDLTTPPQVRNTFLLYKKSKKRPLEHSPPPQFEDERNLVVVPSLEKREVVSSDSVRITKVSHALVCVSHRASTLPPELDRRKKPRRGIPNEMIEQWLGYHSG